jgi:uncharacterized delta-60 repeat protein
VTTIQIRRLRLPRWSAIAALAVTALALCVGVALAATAGDLDPSFDGDGKRILPLRAAPGDVLAQPDGKILVTDIDSFTILRLNSDGSLDNGFGGDGAVAADFGAGAKIGSAALQADGKIVAAGLTGSGAIAVARFKPNGSLDPTFDPGGPDGDGKKVYTDRVMIPAATLVQPDGRIVIAGASPAGITAIRANPDGSLDGTSFASAHDLFDHESVSAAALAPDGAIVAAGHSQTGGSNDLDIVVARFNPNGTLDETLAGTGMTKLGPNDRDDSAREVLLQPDGKILLAGDSGSGEKRMTVTRLNRDGTLDTAFGDGGMAAPDFPGHDIAAGAALQPDGKILLAGTTDPDGGHFAVARLGSNGALDPTFAVGGKTTISFGDIALAYAAGLQPDGKLVIAGLAVVENRTAIRTALARVLADQPPDGGGPGGGGPRGGGGPGGGPDDPPNVQRCAGRRATIVGTAGNDTLRGTPRADVIVALGGNDRISARGGNDVVCGGRGNDRLAGGAGADRLHGGHGRDVLAGGPGRDRLNGGPQRDRCLGGAARDRATACEVKRSL